MAAPLPPEQVLGQIILARTPYHTMTMPTDIDWQSAIEWDGQRVLWNFRGIDRRVVKAIRIPVTITYTNSATGNPETYRDWLLIGYEGGEGE